MLLADSTVASQAEQLGERFIGVRVIFHGEFTCIGAVD
jgi:hypothetical protein